MIVINADRSILLTRGDSAELSVTFSGDIPEDGTTALISIKQCLRDSSCKIEKRATISSAGATFTLTSSETKPMLPGLYFWDLRLIYDDGSVITPFDPARFEIKEVVGNV